MPGLAAFIGINRFGLLGITLRHEIDALSGRNESFSGKRLPVKQVCRSCFGGYLKVDRSKFYLPIVEPLYNPLMEVVMLHSCPPQGKAACELVETLIMAGIMAALIMTFVARAYTVNGESMLPTLHHGERLLVDKISYRFIEPARGDIVVFRYPANPKEQFIKRIIGVPGDVVSIRSGTVYVNGVALRLHQCPLASALGTASSRGHLLS